MENLDFQLKMNFSGESENVFRKTLEDGGFTVLFETQLPEDTVDPQSAAGKLAELENAVVDNDAHLNAALAILDPRGKKRLRALEYAAGLPENRRNRHLIYLSGADTTDEDFADLINFARLHRIRNLVPVTGDAPENITLKSCRKHPFFDGCRAVAEIRAQGDGFFPGTTVNPYQYEFYPLIGQYYALIKKFGQGAQFAVAQAGWDMLKLQSLLWYLNLREFYFPVIARLILLTPATIEEINAGKRPGIRISRDFNRSLEKELHYSRNQFEAVQFRRIELQAAGCRLLGLRGIQIAGVGTPGKARFVLDRIGAALKEFTSFPQWLEEYNAYMASAEMAPFQHDFHLFDRSLSRDYPLDEPPVPQLPPAEALSATEKLHRLLLETLFRNAENRSAGNRRLLKKLFVGCRGCDHCRLPATDYICPHRCPKGLLNGPCGGIREDGGCEISGASECVHNRIIRAAYRHNDFTVLEKNFMAPDKEN
ncbi:MAG: methylenetetrahydrofolate reductase C-terminal domain-containing protein [Victivallaceae bacterium]|nr:methylenetetrahydrofolate reductase C-terminal domain-containing protein [Victivallaceae bacterium]